ncbi:hypothetical protein CWN17_25705, partial [Klebsiella pneumoniae]
FMALARLFSWLTSLFLKPIISILLNVYLVRFFRPAGKTTSCFQKSYFSAKHARILLFTNMNEP